MAKTMILRGTSRAPTPDPVSPLPMQDGRLARLTQAGGVEAILALCLAAFSLVAHLAVTGWGPPLLLDLLACLAAASSGRWPRAGGAALACVLVVFLLVPPPWETLGEYATFIPILGAGMRGDRRLRLVLTIAYSPLVAGLTWLDAPSPSGAVLGWVFWIVAFGAMWIIGTTVARAISAQRQARLADLLQQRQTVARELHDTVAASLTRLVMMTERARLRGTATGQELELMSETAATSVQELRWIVNLLREPVNLEQLSLARPTTLVAALKAAEDQLTRHGFSASATVRGETGRLDRRQSEVLSAIITEATNNIIKHGAPEHPAVILVEITDRDAEFTFINSTHAVPDALPNPDALGLQGIRERISEIGGELNTEQHQDRWITHVGLPLVVGRRPPGQAA